MGCCYSKVVAEEIDEISEDEMSIVTSNKEYANFPNLENYFDLKQIWRGVRASVFVGNSKERDGRYAIKIYSTEKKVKRFEVDDTKEIIDSETTLLSYINNQSCVKMIDRIDDEQNKLAILVFPYIPFSLKYLIDKKKLDDEHIRKMFKKIVDGICYLHANGIVHRDIKPDNIMIKKNYDPIIIDFSSAKKLEEENEMLEDSVGSPIFCSPEIHKGDSYDGKKADVWALGVTLYNAIFGKLPFSNDNEIGTYFEQCAKISKHIIEDEISYDRETPISASLQDLFNHVLEKDPVKRFTIEEMKNHKWFKDVEFC